ncbi:MAG: hypothetical protein KKA73_04225 [Chloroflexi bacterium]|nr:hypothetical protein [Chloroflexota bacterium]MBU1746873.1 hypothetical protein [Chloroflexota bacterium]
MIQKLAFVAGVVMGMLYLMAAVTMILTYYFTGRLPALSMGSDASTRPLWPRLNLLTADEMVAQVREQARRELEGR